MSNRQDLSQTYVEFIRILFAVVLGQSFILASSGEFRGWFLNPETNFVQLSTLFLTYSLVITSWIGYHQSTRPLPEGLPISNPGRFIVDVALLFLYYVAFEATPSFQGVLLIYAIVFTLYLVWNLLRLREYWSPQTKTRLTSRTVTAGGFAVAFWIIYVGYQTLYSRVAGLEMLMIPILALLIIFRLMPRPRGQGPKLPQGTSETQPAAGR